MSANGWDHFYLEQGTVHVTTDYPHLSDLMLDEGVAGTDSNQGSHLTNTYHVKYDNYNLLILDLGHQPLYFTSHELYLLLLELLLKI